MKSSPVPNHPGHTELLVEKGTDRLFSTLQTYLVLNACFAKGFLPPEEWGQGDWFFYQCKAYGPFEVRLPLVGPIENAKLGLEANYVKLTLAPWTPRPDSPLSEPNVHAYVFKMIFPIFTEFYENHLVEIQRCFGEAAAKWPPIWQFARVVRNAMAHGSRINFKNPNAVPVSWKGLSYGPAQNGRNIFGTDIEVGDILVLMFLMSATFDAIDIADKLRGL
ncbi:hypothetical protein [Acidovorax sp. GW101-3H11]|uniref:hypothetical protein n=1 Tax=Acidovorax sp. GW101-3H11 TaxID=1813946 RepID=UPI000A479561|nr:hypothetical protein [Acidovorax sp. GW101-3H11]